jgi:hypothetical protein
VFPFLVLISLLAGCSVYDPGLIDFGPNVGGLGGGSGGGLGGGSGGGTGGSSNGGSSGSSGGGGGAADAGIITECIPNPDDDGTCPEICPEICDGKDNDCDGDIDEAGAEYWCELDHAFARCEQGQCEVDNCETGFGDCNNSSTDGCEKVLGTLDDCGACGDACLPGDHVLEVVCLDGACQVDRCELGYGDCDGNAGNGCEVLLTSMDNCGGCDVSCGRESCAGGFCTAAVCDPGTADCDRNPDNGCETALDTTTNCVICGKSCEFDNASATCESGSCEFTRCKTGFGDCNDDLGDGCETALDTETDCGGCGVSCTITDESCVGGVCTSQDCAPGFADCDGNASNGCEASLNTLQNCGFCGVACEPIGGMPVTCESGVCEIEACDPGWHDCDQDPSNGCESELKDSSNCGACGVECSFNNATASCATGTCEFGACNQGYADCNGNTSDGCEIQLGTDAHCSACNDACSATQACQNGSCVVVQCDPLSCPRDSCIWGTLPCCKADNTCGCAWPALPCL